jgi:uncharacterized protein
MAAKYEFFKDASGAFRFRLKAANGRIIASSEGYKSNAGAEKTNAPGATVVDKTKPTVPKKPPAETAEDYNRRTKQQQDKLRVELQKRPFKIGK